MTSSLTGWSRSPALSNSLDQQALADKLTTKTKRIIKIQAKLQELEHSKWPSLLQLARMELTPHNQIRVSEQLKLS